MASLTDPLSPVGDGTGYEYRSTGRGNRATGRSRPAVPRTPRSLRTDGDDRPGPHSPATLTDGEPETRLQRHLPPQLDGHLHRLAGPGDGHLPEVDVPDHIRRAD